MGLEKEKKDIRNSGYMRNPNGRSRIRNGHITGNGNCKRWND